ncbi:hypothetical protein EMIHUDRAFT_233497 [Emiliania huxleyi CCMP1516]|uniref:Uncharacterized protein n=2 Tax=Emiliania huxleyi TaxID=2903 RepID=A0A0D3K1Z0_EMIH1|nr:hypothetical protein EMIHUDRAFT_233497 [Emiliania huxleyi CCMP1516]EOD29775.1 hypothetical protein EMIHUDRAFT_233497 [Emiliania huxleyi CCMP1516]|eukprot:XP_005782204.1 hypothetical protein EMIHUDRAFT_233497 [Emiliania huxleyi CCMP1516]
MANDTAVITAAHTAGLDVVWPRGSRLGERLDLMGQADVIFLPHGADGANLVFMQPCTLLVQLCPCGYRDKDSCEAHYFGNLARALGGGYVAAHLQHDENPTSRRQCVAARKKWNTATMFASEPFLIALLAHAINEYQRLFTNSHVAEGVRWGVHGVPYHAESTLKELVMKASGDLILPTELLAFC